MPHINCYCIAVGAQSKDHTVGLIYRVDGFKCDIDVKGFTGEVGTITWLFIQN